LREEIEEFVSTVRGKNNRRKLLNSLQNIAGQMGDDWASWSWTDPPSKYARAISSWLENGVKPSTVATRVKHLRRFASYLNSTGRLSDEDNNFVRGQFSYSDNWASSEMISGRMLTHEEALKLIGYPLNTPYRRQAHAAFWVQITTGMRGDELCNLRLSHYDEEREAVLVRDAKTLHERWAPLPQAARIAIAAHRVDCDPSHPWLIQRLNPRAKTRQCELRGINKMYFTMAQTMGVNKFTAHDLRRTVASRLLDQGEDISTVSRVLGHRSATTTMKYDRRPESKRRAAVESLESSLLEAAPAMAQRLGNLKYYLNVRDKGMKGSEVERNH
tara:strand:+ start:4654 stop:5643 length:990 start_codon:yes stop_codon:yes gene_type:complete